LDAEDFAHGVNIIRLFGCNDKPLAEVACDAVWELATHEPYATALGKAGACGVVADLLLAWGWVDANLAWNACSAIANLACESAANRSWLGDEGACARVVHVMCKWGGTDKVVAFYGCRAVWMLAGDDANRLELGEVGACEAVVDMLRLWGGMGEDVASSACGAICSLVAIEVHRTKLKTLGAVAAIETSLRNDYTAEALQGLL
jgi:hypothetical protein